MSDVLAHCDLRADEVDLVAEAERTVRQPTYYRPAFSDEQVAQIERATSAVKRQLDALTQL
jgi:hypothetical protein